MQKRKNKNRVENTRFFERTKILAFSILLSQVVTILISPVLTRIYSPEDFALLAVFTTLFTTFLPCVSGRYDIAIVALKDELESQKMVALSLYVNLIFCIVFLIITYTNYKVFEFWSFPNLLGILVFSVPIMLFINGIFSTFKYTANRNEQYKLIGTATLMQGIVTASLMLIFGLSSSPSHVGMILSMMLGSSAASIYLGRYHRKFIRTLTSFSRRDLLFLSKKYIDYPCFDAIPSLLDGITLAFPVFILARYYPAEITGYYALLLRVANAPLGFISQSFSQVHFREITAYVHDGRDALPYLLRATYTLTLIVLLPCLVLSFFSPDLFAFIFGEDWRYAGQLLSILMPSFAVKFVVSTLSPVFAPTGNNFLGASWKILAFVIVAFTYLISADRLDVLDFFRMMLVVDIFLYFLYFGFIILALKKPRVCI